MSTHKKIKVIATTRVQWDAIVAHAQRLGAVSRDNQYGFNPDKTAMIVDNNYIKYSSPTMKPVAGAVVPLKISVDEFLGLKSLHDAAFIGMPQVDCSSKVAAAVKEVTAATPSLGKNMKVVSCAVLEQSAVIFKSVGLPALKTLGVQVTMDGETPYIINIDENTAEELTPALVAQYAKADLLEDKTTPWTLYANQFQLYTELKYSKLVDAQKA